MCPGYLHEMKTRILICIIFAFFLSLSQGDPVVVKESFVTKGDENYKFQSLATWHGSKNNHWLIFTAKETHALLIYDAFNGSFIKQVGEQGSRLGQFDRPNGISISGDKVFVVEQNNQRVQVLTLPDFFKLGSFGIDHLVNPSDLFVWPKNNHEMTVYVTDNYETETEEKPPLNELGRRVHVFDVTTIEVDSVESQWIKSFGDPANDSLMVGVAGISNQGPPIKCYSLDGVFTGEMIGQGVFQNQPEGIALWETGNKSGYWIFTDQGEELNLFHLFDRISLDHVGTFKERSP